MTKPYDSAIMMTSEQRGTLPTTKGKRMATVTGSKVAIELPTDTEWLDDKGELCEVSYRGRLAARFAKGISCPKVSEGATRNRFQRRAEVADSAITWYDVRADEWVDGKFATAHTHGCWPKKASKSERVGNACANTVRIYVRKYGAMDSADWDNLKVVSLAEDSPVIGFVWVGE